MCVAPFPLPLGSACLSPFTSIGGRTSVPAIWIGATFVGGCNDGPLGGVRALADRGELAPMLRKAGALA